MKTTFKGCQLMHYNIRGIKNKFEELYTIIKDIDQIKIICLNEHKLKESNKSILNKLPNFTLADGYFRTKSAGGSCILLHETINFIVRQDLKEFNDEYCFESSCIEIIDCKIIVVSIYRIPGSSVTQLFLCKFRSFLELIQKKDFSKKIIVVADFNIDI